MGLFYLTVCKHLITDKYNMYETKKKPPRIGVLHPELKDGSQLYTPEDALAEAVNLVSALELDVALTGIAPLREIHPKHYLGRGKAEEWRTLCEAEKLDAVLINTELSPTQHKSLEEVLGVKVMDRTGVILEIFAVRAKTKAGRLQVELAQINYQLSRLVRAWTHLERQRGGASKTGGPGERQIELDRRMLRERASTLKNKLENLTKQRQVQRKARVQTLPQVALVGYTNAGKSTLFTALTKVDAGSADMLFATLDPLTRVFSLNDDLQISLSDTVGFISGLPHELVAAFQSTLEEVAEADIILHIHDISSPHFKAQWQDVDAVLAEIGAAEVPRIHIANKVDISELDSAHFPPNAISVSAVTGEGVVDLQTALLNHLTAQHITCTLALPFHAGAIHAYVHAHGQQVVEDITDDGWCLTAGLPHTHWRKVVHMLQQKNIVVSEDLIQFLPNDKEEWE